MCVRIPNSGSSKLKDATETLQQEHWQKGVQESSLSWSWSWDVTFVTPTELSQLLFASLHGTRKSAMM